MNFRLPKIDDVQERFNELFVRKNGCTIISRADFDLSSTYPTEIITCRFSDGVQQDFFCKYLNGKKHLSYGHRGGLQHEINVYREILSKSSLTTPKFFGRCYYDDLDETVLILEFLNGSCKFTSTDTPGVFLKKAATWIGQFHNEQKENLYPFLPHYDESYYRIWTKKLAILIPTLPTQYDWVKKINIYFIENIHVLIRCPQTIIHGEYYPQNILVRDNKIYPIDWESAAIGPGEVDLASLIENWEDNETDNLIEIYKTIRWKETENIPEDFDNVLLMSRIYFQLRWLAEFSYVWIEQPKHFYLLKKLALKAGCI